MPYTMHKKKSGKVSVTGPSGVHAKGTTPAKAQAQVNLLRGIEHGWKPTGKKSKKSNQMDAMKHMVKK